jgi:hypothetical protein
MTLLHNWHGVVRRPHEVAPYLHEHYPDFSGNYDVAASRLTSLINGVEWVLVRLEQRGLAVVYPDVMTVPVIANKNMSIGVLSHPGGALSELWVEIRHLERISSFDQDVARMAERKHWSVELGLTGDQLFHNIGVEEGHHTVASTYQSHDAQPEPAVGEGHDRWVRYHAQDAEYTALQWRVETVREHGQLRAYSRTKRLLDAVTRYREVNGPAGERWPDAVVQRLGVSPIPLLQLPARSTLAPVQGAGGGNPAQLA